MVRGGRRQPARLPDHGALRDERRRQELRAARRPRCAGSATRRAATSPTSALRGCCRVVFSAWSLDDPLAALKEAVAAAARGVAPELAGEPPDGSLADVLEAWPERIEGPLLLVLDQFEEFFLYHDRPGDSALDELAAALRRRNPAVHFLLSIREDSLAKLDRFKGHVPGLLDHLLRIEHLDRDAAREAIVEPLERWNADAAPGEEVEAEPTLVEAVLDQVTAGQVSLADGRRGQGAPGTAPRGDRRAVPPARARAPLGRGAPPLGTGRGRAASPAPAGARAISAARNGS